MINNLDKNPFNIGLIVVGWIFFWKLNPNITHTFVGNYCVCGGSSGPNTDSARVRTFSDSPHELLSVPPPRDTTTK